MANEVAERYAQGLFELAWEKDTAESKKEQAEGLLQTIGSTPELNVFLRAVKITKDEKKSFIESAFADALDIDMIHFIKLLIDKGRIYYLRDILEEFVRLANERLGIENAVVWSARPLKEADLKRLLEALEKKSGKCVLMGISAGSMNAASLVYAQPEEEGESLDPKYERFLPGLGLTDVKIIPHYQRIRDRILDGKRLFEEITVPDSMGRYLYLLSDGSYLYTNGDISRIYGELHIMKDGVIRRVANEGGVTALIGE